MANVPSRYPVEPHAERCGDTFRTSAFVTGELPGTDFFGKHLNATIRPIYFRDNTVADPTYWPEIGNNGWEFQEVVDKIRERIDSTASHLGIYDHYPIVKKNTPALRWLLEHADAEVDAAEGAFDDFTPALPPEPGEPIKYPKAVQDRVMRRLRDALTHLRCAEYWGTRLQLYHEAKEEYVPPPRDPSKWITARTGEYKPPLGFKSPPPAPTVLPDPDALPPPDAVGEGPTAPTAQRWKVAAAIAGVAAAFFFLPKLLK